MRFLWRKGSYRPDGHSILPYRGAGGRTGASAAGCQPLVPGRHLRGANAPSRSALTSSTGSDGRFVGHLQSPAGIVRGAVEMVHMQRDDDGSMAAIAIPQHLHLVDGAP